VDVANSQLNAANAQKSSAVAQKQAAEEQLRIVITKGPADIADSNAKVHQAELALDNAKANRNQVPAYKENLSALRSVVESSRAAVKTAQTHLSDTILKSPLNGFVTARYMDPGAVATPGQPILAVLAIRQVWVTIPVREEVSRAVYMGMPAQAVFDALPGRTF